LIAISVFPVVSILRRVSFEAQRWKESSHSPFGALNELTGEDEDEDEEEE